MNEFIQIQLIKLNIVSKSKYHICFFSNGLYEIRNDDYKGWFIGCFSIKDLQKELDILIDSFLIKKKE